MKAPGLHTAFAPALARLRRRCGTGNLQRRLASLHLLDADTALFALNNSAYTMKRERK